MDVDFASSLSSFLRYHLKKILGMIMKSTGERYSVLARLVMKF